MKTKDPGLLNSAKNMWRCLSVTSQARLVCLNVKCRHISLFSILLSQCPFLWCPCSIPLDSGDTGGICFKMTSSQYKILILNSQVSHNAFVSQALFFPRIF